MGGREAAAWPRCCRATVTRKGLKTGPRSKPCGAWLACPASPAHRRRDVRGRRAARSRRSGSSAPTPPNPCPTRPGADRAVTLRAGHPARAFADTATARFADYQLPPPPGARRKARSPTASAASAACALPCRRWARPAPIGRSPAASPRALTPLLGRAPRLTADSAEALWLEHRAATAGRDLDISGLSWACWTTTAHSSGLCRRPAAARFYTDGQFCHPNGRARFVASPFRPTAEAHHRRAALCSPPAACATNGMA